MRRRWIAIVSIAVVVSLSGLVLAQIDQHEQQRRRAQFLEAYKAGLNGNTAHARSMAAALEGYVLYPYLEYAVLKGRLSGASDKEVLALLEKYPDFAFVPRLKMAWLEQLADAEAWSRLLNYYDGGGDRELRCQVLQARLATGATQTLASDAVALWRVPYSQHEACDPVFKWLYENGHISDELRFERVALALDAGNTSLAAYLAGQLDGEWRRWYERWRAMLNDPEAVIPQSKGWPDTDIAQRIVADGLKRVAANRESGGVAWGLWEQIAGVFEFSNSERGALMRSLALDAATDYHADALKMLDAVPDYAANASVRAWRIRIPLMRRDWKQVRKGIEALPPAERDEKVWRYWRAQALEETGKEASAELIYQELAQDVSYYGFLAADQIDAPYAIEPDDIKPARDAMRELTQIPAMARALELFHVGLDVFARQAWDRALNDAGRVRLLQAALLADQHGWHDRAIFTLADLGAWSAYELRFPLAFKSHVLALAKQRGIDPAWMYGVIRSESLFQTDAHSGAGAYGLMQLLPGTGRDQSQSLGLGWKGAYGLFDPEYNLQLGSAYLTGLSKRYNGNPVLASAAYNAGPHEVDQWIKQNPPEYAAIWIETIPFYETRAYLKRVLAFSVLYDWQLDDDITRLSARLPGSHRSAD